jgi:predicted nicotinamide N-methyase
VIIGADCLFFQDFHDQLIHLLQTILSPDGTVILFQPSRSHSMENFIQKAELVFEVDLREEYSEKVTKRKTKFHVFISLMFFFWFFFSFPFSIHTDNRRKAIIS